MLDGSNSRFRRLERQTGASFSVPQPRLHPLDNPEAAFAAWQMQCRTVRHEAIAPSHTVRAFEACASNMPSADFCTAIRWDYSHLSSAPTEHRADLPGYGTELSLHKRRIYKAHPDAEGGLRCHVPAHPGCTTPHIRFLFVVPQFWIGLP